MVMGQRAFFFARTVKVTSDKATILLVDTYHFEMVRGPAWAGDGWGSGLGRIHSNPLIETIIRVSGHLGPFWTQSFPQQPVCGMDFVGYFFRSFEGSGFAASFCMRHGGAIIRSDHHINIHHHKHS